MAENSFSDDVIRRPAEVTTRRIREQVSGEKDRADRLPDLLDP
jgi:hypothetical protein